MEQIKDILLIIHQQDSVLHNVVSFTKVAFQVLSSG
jgi:hypothetical protein